MQYVAHRRGFTFTDLIVLLVCIVLLSGSAIVLANGAMGGRERANRINCASNLRKIYHALIIYVNDNRGAYPRTRADLSGKLTQFSGSDAVEPFNSANAPAVNDVTAVMFMLARDRNLYMSEFVCPSSAAEIWNQNGKPTLQVSNFPSDRYLSYGFVNVYPTQRAIDLGYMSYIGVDVAFAIAADIGTGDPAALALDSNSPQSQQKAGNSNNHDREGQNVLYNDGHVDWSSNAFAGQDRDNIYTAAAIIPASGGNPATQRNPATSVPGTDPQLPFDSIILPISTLAPAPADSPQNRETQLVIGFFAITAIVAAGVWLYTRTRRAATQGNA